MPDSPSAQVAVVDYGMGNMFSVSQACERAGLQALITSSPKEIWDADAVILPGVGAFGDAMDTLTRLDLVSCLRDLAASPKPLVGICLGMQLMMTESHEFGRHRGLGIIEGEVLRLEVSYNGPRAFKVPQVGWNRIWSVGTGHQGDGPQGMAAQWGAPQLEGLSNGEYMYFVHSFYANPANASLVVSPTRYGDIEFCSSLRSGSVFACQFHPERSGFAGLSIYQRLAELITKPKHRRVNV